MARHCSTILCVAVAALVALGLIMLASTSAWVKGVEAPYHFLTRQTIMVVVGLIAAIFAARWPVENFRKLAPWMFCGACVLLILCYVPGIARRNLRLETLDQGSRRRPVPAVRAGQNRRRDLPGRVVRPLANRSPHLLARLCAARHDRRRSHPADRRRNRRRHRALAFRRGRRDVVLCREPACFTPCRPRCP